MVLPSYSNRARLQDDRNGAHIAQLTYNLSQKAILLPRFED